MTRLCDSLRQKLPGRTIVEPGDVDYDNIRATWNIKTSFEPRAIVQVESSDDVSTAIRIARDNGITQINGRGGGHSFEGQSLGAGNPDAFIIDVTKINDITIDRTTKVATVGAGALLGSLAFKAFENGQLMAPHGMGVTVGVGGHSQAGGYGFYTRTYGTFVDHILQYEVVTADGEVVIANADENSDLHWALRGSGTGSFGIITQLKVQLRDAPRHVAMFSVAYPLDESFVENYANIQTYMMRAPLSVNPMVAMWKGELELTGTVLTDTEEDLHQVLTDLESSFTSAVRADFRKVSYLDTVVSMGLEQASAPYYPNIDSLVREKNQNLRWMKIKAGFMPGELPLPAIRELAEVVKVQNPIGTRIQVLGLNPDIEVDRNRNSIKEQNCPLLMGMSVWIEAGGQSQKEIERATNEGESRVPWLDRAYEIYYPYVSGGYIGDDDLDEGKHGRNLHESYFGENLPRLQQVKRKYDPSNLFHNPLSVPI